MFCVLLNIFQLLIPQFYMPKLEISYNQIAGALKNANPSFSKCMSEMKSTLVDLTDKLSGCPDLFTFSKFRNSFSGNFTDSFNETLNGTFMGKHWPYSHTPTNCFNTFLSLFQHNPNICFKNFTTSFSQTFLSVSQPEFFSLDHWTPSFKSSFIFVSLFFIGTLNYFLIKRSKIKDPSKVSFYLNKIFKMVLILLFSLLLLLFKYPI